MLFVRPTISDKPLQIMVCLNVPVAMEQAKIPEVFTQKPLITENVQKKFVAMELFHLSTICLLKQPAEPQQTSQTYALI